MTSRRMRIMDAPPRLVLFVVIIITLTLSAGGLVYLSQSPWLPLAGTTPRTATESLRLVLLATQTPLPPTPPTVSPAMGQPEGGAPSGPTGTLTNQTMMYSRQAAGYAALLMPPSRAREPLPSSPTSPAPLLLPSPTPATPSIARPDFLR